MEDHYRDEGTYQETLFTAFMGRITIMAWWSRNRTEEVVQPRKEGTVHGGSWDIRDETMGKQR